MTDSAYGLLCLEGPLTIEHAGTLRQRLLDALRETPQLRLDVRAISRVDATFMQLLIGAGHTSRALGGRVVVDRPWPACLQSLIDSGGFGHVVRDFTEVSA